MPIKTKRWDDPRETNDGFRLLVCRYRPRGLPKTKETWDAWDKHLGPSPELLAEWHARKKSNAPMPWSDYRRRYVSEMKAEVARIHDLALRAATGETITLLCSSACMDETHCHRSLLRALIEKNVSRGARA